MGGTSKPAHLKVGATELDREIAATDAEIDKLVYELHGITDEERKIYRGIAVAAVSDRRFVDQRSTLQWACYTSRVCGG
ncbi:MAG TPA: hypothetical protein VM182_14810 [Terriglobia bacterium]|nr:hypothetical protein [Terriglobia bacterium]